MLTKLEEQVLITVWRLKGEAYGVSVFQELENANEKKLTMGVIYDILERLRKNSMLETFMGSTTPKRGGMRKKFYRINNSGIEALTRSKEAHDRVMEGFEELVRGRKSEKAV